MYKFYVRVAVIAIVLMSVQACQSIQSTDDFLVRPFEPNPLNIEELRTGKKYPELNNLWEYTLLAAAAYDELDISNVTCGGFIAPPVPWVKVTGFDQDAEFPLRPGGRVRVPGIGYKVWKENRPDGGNRVAIVFRGTDVKEFGDWYSNANWLTRFSLLTWNQYAQTRDLIALLVPKLQQKFGSDIEIITVGHSLGGGLAQFAAYNSEQIKTVFAFASSPVTGYSTVDHWERADNVRGVSIFRIYEAGEILATLRWAARRLVRLKDANPRIAEVRFNFRSTFRQGSIGGGLIGQHSIIQLGCDLHCWVEQGGNERMCKMAIPKPDSKS